MLQNLLEALFKHKSLTIVPESLDLMGLKIYICNKFPGAVTVVQRSTAREFRSITYLT